MFIGLLILFIKKESLKLSCAIFIPGNILYDIFFYINKKKKIKIKLNDFEYHPFCLLLIYSIISNNKISNNHFPSDISIPNVFK